MADQPTEIGIARKARDAAAEAEQLRAENACAACANRCCRYSWLPRKYCACAAAGNGAATAGATGQLPSSKTTPRAPRSTVSLRIVLLITAWMKPTKLRQTRANPS